MLLYMKKTTTIYESNLSQSRINITGMLNNKNEFSTCALKTKDLEYFSSGNQNTLVCLVWDQLRGSVGSHKNVEVL